jgi:hypothetical protein
MVMITDSINVCSMLPSQTVTPIPSVFTINGKTYRTIKLMMIPANHNVSQLIGVVKNFKIGLAISYISVKITHITRRMGVALQESGDIDSPPCENHIASPTKTMVFAKTDETMRFIMKELTKHKCSTIVDNREVFARGKTW